MSRRESKNLWILTEERPRASAIKTIFEYFAKQQGVGFLGGDVRVIPILDKDRCFSFTYRIVGIECNSVDNIFVKTVSGDSSFVDYLLFYQEAEPTSSDVPFCAIEETKTDDSESRNTGVYQRCSKFVYIRHYYPTTKLVMLYSLLVPQHQKATATSDFGNRLLLTYGVDIIGKTVDASLKPFKSIDEIIEAKASMRKAPKGNVPILITKYSDRVEISGRLYKGGSIAHDPNIGALTMIAAVLRALGWSDDIVFTQHGLVQANVGVRNKFLLIASILGVNLDGLNTPRPSMPAHYWHYETEGEKLGTIFIHIAIESFTRGYSIFENHAGCEKSYFMTSQAEHIALEKYADRAKYKAGDRTQIISIPDIVFIDIDNSQSILVEGKKFSALSQGIAELNNYDSFESRYLQKSYPNFTVVKSIVLYGSNNESVAEVEVGFLLNKHGRLVLGVKAPRLFVQAVENLLDFWK